MVARGNFPPGSPGESMLFNRFTIFDTQPVNFIGRLEMSDQITSFDALPDSAFLRESQLVQSSKRPETPAPLPFSAPTLWRKVKNGTFPKPVKLSERITAWKVGDVRKWMAEQASA